MAGRTAFLLLAASITPAACGCGTVKNLSASPFPIPINDHPQSVYGGVRLDAKGASVIVSGHGVPPLALAMTIDLPFSAVGDTLTLPYILYLQSQKQKAANDASQADTSQAVPNR